MDTYWLKPIFLVLSIFAFVYLLILLEDSWGVDWETDVNPVIISLLPWIVILGLGIFIFVYIMERK